MKENSGFLLFHCVSDIVVKHNETRVNLAYHYLFSNFVSELFNV